MKGWLIPISGMAYSVDINPERFTSDVYKLLNCRSIDYVNLESSKDGDVDLIVNDEFELDGSSDNFQLKKSYELKLLQTLIKGPAIIVKYDRNEDLVDCTSYDMHRMSKIYGFSYKK